MAKSKFNLSNYIGAGGLGVSKLDTITAIPMEDIRPDERNFYRVEGVDELADNIRLVGLQQPIRVRPDGQGGYVIVSGHRRFAALQQLRDGDRERWSDVPCIVEDGNASESMQELRLILANSDTRRMSNAEISRQAARVEELLLQLKNEGVEFEGRMRDRVAEICQVSASKLARLKMIRDNLPEELRESWEAGDISEDCAGKIATLRRDDPDTCEAILPILLEMDKTRGVSSYLVRWLADICTRLQSTTCPYSADGCDHLEEALWTTAERGIGCSCCRGCYRVADCEHACQHCAGEAAAMVEARQAKKEQADALKRRKEEQIAVLWYRFGAARREAGLNIEQAVGRTLRKWETKKMEKLERAAAYDEHDDIPSQYISLGGVNELCGIADRLGVSVDYLLGREPTEEKPDD